MHVTPTECGQYRDPSTKNTLSLFFLFLFFVLLFAFCFSSRILQAIRRNHIVVVGVFNIISGFIAGSIWFCKHTWEKRCERWKRVTGKGNKKTKCFYLCNFRVENSAKSVLSPIVIIVVNTSVRMCVCCVCREQQKEGNSNNNSASSVIKHK